MIYICTHKDLELLKNYKYDNTFQNNYKVLNLDQLQKLYPNDLILQLHPYLNEWVAQYYIHQYMGFNDIDGFCHYRRIIDYDHINFNRIKNTNGTQFFSVYMENIEFYEIDMTNKKKYCYIDIHGKYWKNYVLYNDFVEFNDNIGKNIINVDYLDKITNVEDINQFFWHPSKELYVSTKYNLNLIFNYIYEYVKFILQKYNIKSIEDFKNHIIRDVHNNKKYEEYDDGQLKEYYWRGYAVFIEYLIGILIKYYCNGFSEYLYVKQWLNESKYFKSQN